MAREQPGQTLQPTALVHEAWLRLGAGARFENRAHFFAAAADAMRRILIERARRKLAARRGRFSIRGVACSPKVDPGTMRVGGAKALPNSHQGTRTPGSGHIRRCSVCRPKRTSASTQTRPVENFPLHLRPPRRRLREEK